MKLPVLNWTGAAQGETEFPDELVIRNGRGSQAVHETVVAYMANQRLGTAKTKQMGEVSGTGKKPYRQKGTGNARAGSFQSPIWRGGAVVFGPRPRDYSMRVPQKIKALAFRKALSERLIAGDVLVVDDLKLDSHKTKPFAVALDKLTGRSRSTLVVAEAVDTNLQRAARNLPRVAVAPARAVNIYEVLRYHKIVATKAALAQLQARMGRS